MTVDYPIGTRLSLKDKTLEIVEDSDGVEDCRECALLKADDYSLDGRICASTRCCATYREGERTDRKSVHWKLVKGSV